MQTNDVKRGAKVKLKDGRIMEVMDSRKGNARRIRGQSLMFPGGTDDGDEHVWEWAEVQLPDGSWEAIELTPDQLEVKHLVDATQGAKDEIDVKQAVEDAREEALRGESAGPECAGCGKSYDTSILDACPHCGRPNPGYE